MPPIIPPRTGPRLTLAGGGAKPNRGQLPAGVAILALFANSTLSTAGDGLSALTAKLTVSTALALAQGPSRVNMARGSAFKESIALVANNVSFGAYGTGAAPLMKGNVPLALSWAAYSGSYGPAYLTNTGFETWTNTAVGPDGWTTQATGASNGTNSGVLKDNTNASNQAVRFDVGTANASVACKQVTKYSVSSGQTFSVPVEHAVTPVGAKGAVRIYVTDDLGNQQNLALDGSWSTTTQSLLVSASNDPQAPATTTFTGVVPPGVTGKAITVELQRGTAAVGGQAYKVYWFAASLSGPIGTIGSNIFRAARSVQVWTVAVNGTTLNAGVTPETLTNGQWCWTGGYLYVRLDSVTTAADWYNQLLEVDGLTHAFTSQSPAIASPAIADLTFQGYAGRAIQLQYTTGPRVERSSFIGNARGTSGSSTQDNNGVVALLHGLDAVVQDNRWLSNLNDNLYFFNVKRWIVRRNVFGGADQVTADCFQADYFVDGTNSPASGSLGANATGSHGLYDTNYADQRAAQVSQKGCSIVTQGDGDTFQNSAHIGGHYGFSVNGNNQTVTGNLAAFQSGVNYAASFYRSWPANLTNHTYRDDIAHGSTNGVYRAETTETGFTATGSEKDTAIVYDHMTISYCTTAGMNLAGAGLGFAGNITNSIFFNPTASGPDLCLTSAGSGDILVDYNCYGPARTGQFKVGNTSYDSLAAFKAAFPAWNQHSISADPLLVDPNNGDFGLQSGSPCIGAASDGTNIGARGPVTRIAKNQPWFVTGTAPAALPTNAQWAAAVAAAA